MSKVGDSYRSLIKFIRSHPGYENTKIITHTYDNLVPSPHGATFALGLVQVGKYGWLYPQLETYNILGNARQGSATAVLLDAFQAELDSVQREYPDNFVVFNTRGVLERARASNLSEVPI